MFEMDCLCFRMVVFLCQEQNVDTSPEVLLGFAGRVGLDGLCGPWDNRLHSISTCDLA
jgi:hypothetical protein